MDVTLPDGTVVKGIPEGTTKAQLAEKLKAKGFNVPESWMTGRSSPMSKRYTQDQMDTMRAEALKARQSEQIGEMSLPSRLAAGAGKAVYDTGRGIGQLFGKVSTQDIAEARRLDEPLMATGAGKVGNVLGYVGEAVPLALASPAAGAGAGATALAAKIGLGGAQGAAQGYVAPYASTGEHITNTLAGAGLGALIPGAGAGAGRLIKGLATPEAKALMDAGVRLTPGQMLGGAAKTVEDKLTSVPVIGGAIRKGQQRALDDFNLASVNKALAPMGATLGKGVNAGYEAVQAGREAISKAYDSVLGQMSGRVDSQLTNKIAQTLGKHINTLPETLARKLMNTVDEDVLQKLGVGQPVGGKAIKEVVSNLGNEIRTAQQAQDPAIRELGKAFQAIQGDIKAMLKRQNPGALSEELSNVDAAHARMLRVENAASRVGAQEGKFTPAQLRSAVRAEDASYKKRGFSQGKAMLQDWSDAAQSSLPSKVPDSGTAGRLLMDAGLLGGGAATGHLPMVLAAGAASHALYSRLGSNLMARALAPRQSAAGNFLAQLAQSRLTSPQNALAFRSLAPQPQPVPQIPQQ